MSSLVHAALAVRRSARLSIGFLFAGAFAVLLLLGVFLLPPSALGAEHVAVGVAWAAFFGLRVRTRVRATPVLGVSSALDLELSVMLLVAAFAAVQMTGGVTGELMPLVYVVVAFAASFAQRPAGSMTVLVAILLEAALYFVTEARRDPMPFVYHTLFIGFFGVLNLLFTRAEIARVRERSRQELDDERARVREDARLFRLVAPAADSAKDDERLFRASIDEVHNSLFYTLSLLRDALDLHTCVLFMRSHDQSRINIVELVSDDDDLAEGPFQAGAGAVGAVATRGLVMNLEHVKPGYKGLCYYQGPAKIRSFVGVPVLERENLVGALCADRLTDRPFSPREEAVMRTAASHVLRIMENERVFIQLERSKQEQTSLYRATQNLGSALTEGDVIDAALAAAREIARFDFAVVTAYDPDNRSHSVRRAVGDGAEALTGFSFRDNTSLTAMAVRNRHYLPYRGEYDPTQQVVFTKRVGLKEMRSLLVMPLVVRDDAIGTLTVAAHRSDAFKGSARATLLVLANQMAVALSNAKAVRRLEEMATTDGLTGCLNKRAFNEALAQKLKSAERFGRKLSLVVTDIDHFKSVNDTYGHATGDVVIKELGEVLRRVKRETDIVSRFGGEEFCVLCEETDTQGAVLLAERVREVLRETVFQTELGKLQVTASLGVATFPLDASSDHELFEIADKALYAAKRGGRNRVCTAQDA